MNKRSAVITDSAAGLPDFAMEKYDIHTVLLCVHFGNRRFLDKIEMTANQFFQRLHDDVLSDSHEGSSILWELRA